MVENLAQNQYDEELTKEYNSEERLSNPQQFMLYSAWLEELADRWN